MQRTPLTSSVVRSAGYDGSAQCLELEFKSGRIYRFEGVPESVYAWLLRTPSKGSYVARMINDRYAYSDVTPAAPETEADLADTLRASLQVARDEGVREKD